MHSFKTSILLSADSERRRNPAQQMITQLPTTTLKQNIPDRSFNRHVAWYEKILPQYRKKIDSYKLWKLTKLLNGNNPKKAQTVL